MIEIKLEKCTPEEQQKKMMLSYAKLAAEKAEVENKSVSRILEEIANDFCENYCKYPDIWDEEKEGCELCDSEFCASCPINRLT